MKYLLIDFGASFIKTCLYDKSVDKITRSIDFDSPLQDRHKIDKQELHSLLYRIVGRPDLDGIVCCSILGGMWKNETYHSWKCLDTSKSEGCLISGIFEGQENYHVHAHHGGDKDELLPLGRIFNTTVYSSLADTYCVIESLDVKEDEYVINIGTGSQVISKSDGDLSVVSFIPAGRALLAYERFFKSFGVDFFAELNRTSLEDVINSSLEMDLNIFEQAIGYESGGSVTNMHEDNLTPNNFFASLIRCFVLQYSKHMPNTAKPKIRLSGGIPSKIKILKDVFRHYNRREVSIEGCETHSTHVGMIKYINKYL